MAAYSPRNLPKIVDYPPQSKKAKLRNRTVDTTPMVPNEKYLAIDSSNKMENISSNARSTRITHANNYSSIEGSNFMPAVGSPINLGSLLTPAIHVNVNKDESRFSSYKTAQHLYFRES